MKKAIAIVISVMFVFVFTSAAFAADKKEAASQAVKKTDKKRISGEVTAVDAKANTVTVKGRKNEVTVSVDDNTAIKAGKEKKTLADVKVGDRVYAIYTEADGKNVAKRISLKNKKSVKVTEKTMEKTKAAKKKEAAGY